MLITTLFGIRLRPYYGSHVLTSTLLSMTFRLIFTRAGLILCSEPSFLTTRERSNLQLITLTTKANRSLARKCGSAVI